MEAIAVPTRPATWKSTNLEAEVVARSGNEIAGNREVVQSKLNKAATVCPSGESGESSISSGRAAGIIGCFFKSFVPVNSTSTVLGVFLHKEKQCLVASFDKKKNKKNLKHPSVLTVDSLKNTSRYFFLFFFILWCTVSDCYYFGYVFIYGPKTILAIHIYSAHISKEKKHFKKLTDLTWSKFNKTR